MESHARSNDRGHRKRSSKPETTTGSESVKEKIVYDETTGDIYDMFKSVEKQ